MHYKTICLELLQDRHPKYHHHLQASRTLLATLETYATDLKSLHERRKAQLAQARPGSDPTQLSSEALELAIHDLESSLPPESAEGENGSLSLDEAMAFLREATPSA